MEDDLQSLENSARIKISRLSQHRIESKELIFRLHAQLSDSVSLIEFNLLENKLNMHISKTKLLLERERDWIDQKVSRDLHHQSHSDQLQKSYAQSLSLEKYKAEAEKYKNLYNSSDSSDSVKHGNVELLNLQVQVEILSKRAIMAEERFLSAQKSECVLRKQLEEGDTFYIDSKQQSLVLQQDFLELCNKYEVKNYMMLGGC